MMDMDTQLRIFTSRYANEDLAASGLVCVGITAFPPRFKLNYSIRANFRLLAPTPAMLARARSGTLTPKAFEAQYERLLERVGVERILTTLRQFQGDAPGVALICYEDVDAGERCHRRMLAAWLQRKAGLTVPEYTAAALPVAVGYIRRSHESDGRTVSLATQRAAIERYATEQGWHLTAVLEHDGVSGGKRSRFAALDAAVKSHGARYVVAYHLDRVARDAAGLLDWCASAAKRGVELHIVGRGRAETSTAAGYLGVGVEAIMATHFRLVIGEKTKGALLHLRSAGRRWTRVPPFGWAWKDGRGVPDPAEQVIITRALALRAAGLSLRKVSAALTAEGLLGRAGRPLSAETVKSIVRANAVSASTGYLRD